MLLGFSKILVDGSVPDEKSTKKSIENSAEPSKRANCYGPVVGAERLHTHNSSGG